MGVRETGVAILNRLNAENLEKNPDAHDWEPRPGEGPHGEYAAVCRRCHIWDLDRAAREPCPKARKKK
jgi:hypothetical protein